MEAVPKVLEKKKYTFHLLREKKILSYLLIVIVFALYTLNYHVNWTRINFFFFKWNNDYIFNYNLLFEFFLKHNWHFVFKEKFQLQNEKHVIAHGEKSIFLNVWIYNITKKNIFP